jgi:C4-dicarboxylate-specific signal transduction histidine kinase
VKKQLLFQLSFLTFLGFILGYLCCNQALILTGTILFSVTSLAVVSFNSSLDLLFFKRLHKIKRSIANVLKDPKSPPLPIEHNDELSEIIAAINILKKEVIEKQSELQAANDDMEQRIFRRTEQLATSLERLEKENSERIKAEKEAQKHRQQLIEDDKLKTLGVLSAGVAHEINNPNNFIMLNTPIITNILSDMVEYIDQSGVASSQEFGSLSFKEVKEDLPQLLEGLATGSDRIEKIVSSLKRYSQKGHINKTQRVNVNTIIKRALPLIDSLIRKSTDNFQIHLDPSLPSVYGDATQIEQVVVNLLQNSCFALESRDNAVIIKTYQTPDDAMIVVEVSDQGKGIPADIIEKIQDPFFTTRRESGGTGLGLSISTNIARDHKGNLLFESIKGEGTTAKFLIPSV